MDIENRLVVAKGEEGGSGMDWAFGVGRCKQLHLEWISNEVLLYHTGNYTQSLGIDLMEDNIRKRMCVCVCNRVTLLYSRNQQNTVNQL